MNRLLNLILGLLLMSWASVLQAQDNFEIVKMMHYNLLNYRNTTPQCDGSTNPPSTKDAALKTILNHVKPDLVTMNEIGANPVNANRLLSNAFVVDGYDYDFANYSNNATSSLVNMLFYNRNKLRLHHQTYIDKALDGAALVRVIDIYTLYLNDPLALPVGDTVFLHVAVAHLKAGSTQADKDERAKMTAALMSYLSKKKENPSNWVISGDFNVQSSSETSFQNLINDSNESIRFYDPVNSLGTWNNNSNFSNLHTQSTRSTSTSGGCFSSGGMDDRFDFILAGKEVMNNTSYVSYIKNSYKALGQDGIRFNSTINSPSNTLVPQSVADALYAMSDHLPVLMDMSFRKWVAGADFPFLKFDIKVQNPMSNEGFIEINGTSLSSLSLEVFDSRGLLVNTYTTSGDTHTQTAYLSVDQLSKGLYWMYIKQGSTSVATRKFIKL